MKRSLLILILVTIASGSVFSQNKNFQYKFYGFVRGDLFVDSRANSAPIEGLFHLYPLDKVPDANGKDLNANPSVGFNVFTTRVGLDLIGPNVGSARTSAKIETDFGGYTSSNTMLRIRQAYVLLSWDKSNLLVGQTWHPLFGNVAPDILSLSTGSPFQPFNRSPMLRYQYQMSKVKLSAATVWQLQYTSGGPNGFTTDYIKNGCLPEINVGIDFSSKNGWLIGASANMISIKPRTASSWKESLYKVNERMTAFSYEAHMKYTNRNFTVAAKTFLASALDHTLMMGGYGVKSIDPVNGKQKYTPFRHSTSWINFTYGTKWKPSLFVGYSKNLGTIDDLASPNLKYGRGLDMDQLFTINVNMSYNLPHWKLGFEYSPAIASYGTPDAKNGKIKDTHSVTNHRISGLLVYLF